MVGAGEMSLKAVAKSVSKGGGCVMGPSLSPLFLSTTLYSLIKIYRSKFKTIIFVLSVT